MTSVGHAFGSLRERPWFGELENGRWSHFARILLSLIVLLCICNLHAFYEEDELAKASQVSYLAHHGGPSQFHDAPDYYRKDLFSAYYLAATAFHRLTPLDPLATLNLASVLCGVLFLGIVPVFLRRVFNLPEWLSWIAFLNTPVLIINFTYGNEAAFALAMITSTAFALTFPGVGALLVAGIFYALAAFSRTDYLLIGPALVLLTIVREESGINWKKTFFKLSIFAGSSLVFALSYLMIVLRGIPKAEWIHSPPNLKLVLGFLFYSLNPVNILLACIGLGACVVARRFKYLALILVLCQAAPYASLSTFTSPKYLLPTFVVAVVFAVAGMDLLRKRWPILLLAMVLLPWFVAVSPFGVFGPARAPFWYLPTDDGPIPAGGYLTFYGKTKAGFFQRRYDIEMQQLEDAIEEISKRPEGGDLEGSFNVQDLLWWSSQHKRWDISPVHNGHVRIPDINATNTWGPQFVIKTSYLYAFRQEREDRAVLNSACESGSVRAASVNGQPDPFPDLIEYGKTVPPGSDSGLGKRIVFMNALYGGHQFIRSLNFVKEWGGLSWIPQAQFTQRKAQLPAPVYQDKEWVCFTEPVDGATFYSLRYPPAYTRMRKPQAQ